MTGFDVERYVAGELAGLDAAQCRAMAADYLRLRTSVQITMRDMRDWDGDGDETARLAAYLEHLASARYGDCAVCFRVVGAAAAYEELPRGRVWHPRVLWRGLVACYLAVRYGTHRIAHTRCLNDRSYRTAGGTR